ncbi:MAG: choice-of-anchor D domain-containing protein, partial [Candidatus Aminicenantes bacterium]
QAKIANAGGYDAFAAKLNSSGVQQWHTFMGSSTEADRAQGIAIDASNYVYVAGWSGSAWGTPVNDHAGGYEVFAAKLGESEINVKYDDTDIPDGSSYDFDLHNVGTDTDITFTIENTGNVDLTLTTPIAIGGADAGDFSVQQQPTSPVAAGGSTTFVIRYSPTSGGAKTANLSIANNDNDENPYDMTLNGDAQVVYSLTVAAGTGGTTTPFPGISSYNEGTQVNVTATADNGYRFSGWTGDVSSGHENDNPLSITMDSDKSITANFIKQYTLTIAATAGGTTSPVPGTHTYDTGTQVSITATANAGYRFSGWTGNVPAGHENDNPLSITMDSDKSVTANFIKQYTLTIASTAGGTTNPSSGTYTYDSGTQVSITATANAGYRFTGWSGDASGTDNPITITMDSDKSVTANFIRQYTLTIAAGVGGITNPVPGSYIYDEGTQVTISCTAETNFRFSHWSGDASGTTEPLTITMNSDKSITANFIRIIYPPSNFTGRKVVNRSLFLSEYLNSLTWQANPANENIVGYRIYLVEGASQSLLADVNAGTFEYWHRKVEGGKQYIYVIVAVNNEGREGDPASITVQ